jgi:DNA-binding IclR family transcriptional regulator
MEVGAVRYRMAKEIGSLRRANRLVERLIELETASATTLAEELDMPTSSLHDYLVTLESMGYLTRMADGRYRVSGRFLELGNEVRHRYEVYTTAEPELSALAEETGEYVGLMVNDGGLGLILSMKQGEKAAHVRIDRTYPGIRTRLNTTANGKALLSRLPDERVDEIVETYGLSRKTENTIVDRDALSTELERIADRGYAIDDEERFEGMRGISAALTSEPDGTVAAISIYGPTNRLTDDVLHETYSERILQVANVVQVSLTYS